MGNIATAVLLALSIGNIRTDPVDLLDKIDEARHKLRNERVQLIKGTIGMRRVRVGRRSYKQVPIIGIIAREMAIAVMDSKGHIKIARALKSDAGLDVLTSGITLAVRRDNGINSDIAVIEPSGGKVLAVKYPVSNEGGRFGPGPDTIEAVYTPFSPEIRTDEVIARGIKVQAEFINRAYARLKERRVESAAFPNQRVPDVIPRDVLTVLLMNEHIDPTMFKSPGMTKSLVEQVLTIIGTNGEKAYAYSISPAGARGLVQMMPSTYARLAVKYPAAGLMPSFAMGVGDPVNAIMSQILLCDSDWDAIRTRTDIPAERVGPYLAAAYNGGVGRVLTILDYEKTEWMESPSLDTRPTKTVTRKVKVRVRSHGRVRTVYVTKRFSQPIFRSETSKYVNQYHWINDFFAAKRAKQPKPAPDHD